MRVGLGAAVAGSVAFAAGSCSPAPRAEPGEPRTPPPIVTTAETGIEVHWWIADDTDGAVGRVLANFAEPAHPDDSALREAWALNGFRMVRAPALELDAIVASLPPVRIHQRQWVGWVTRWTEIFRGRRAGGATPLLIDARRRSLDRGLTRALLRAWPSFDSEGDSPARAVARVDLAFQLSRVPDEASLPAFATPEIVPPELEGDVFGALTLSDAMEEGFIYIITGETPGVTWRAGSGASGPPPEPARAPERAGPDPLGPPVSAPLTLGEAMFTRRADENAGPPVKALLVILPRTPESFRLLP